MADIKEAAAGTPAAEDNGTAAAMETVSQTAITGRLTATDTTSARAAKNRTGTAGTAQVTGTAKTTEHTRAEIRTSHEPGPEPGFLLSSLAIQAP